MTERFSQSDAASGEVQQEWRRGRDSNPRYVAAQRFSRPPQSATLPPLLKKLTFSKEKAPKA